MQDTPPDIAAPDLDAPTLDDRIGMDDLDRSVVAHANRLAARPEKLAAFLNGLILDGTARRPALQAALAPYMRLPRPEPERRVRARMARLIESLVSANGHVTRDELAAGGFDDAEIARHFGAARRIARAEEIVA